VAARAARRNEAAGPVVAEDFEVRFWGVRGSVACGGPETVRYGGDTSCVEMRCGGHVLIFDAGTGIRGLGAALAGAAPIDADAFFSHTHWDHIAGLPFFRAAYEPANRFHVWSGHLLPDLTIEAVLRLAMRPPLFPVPLDIFRAEITFTDFHAGETLALREGIAVRTAPLNHPDNSTGYRVEYGGRSVCYVTDTEHVPGQPDPNVLGLIDGADIVIYDSTYTDDEFGRFIGWGHSTWQEGVRLCRQAGAKRLVLFHHDPGRDDAALDAIGAEAEAAFPGAVVGRAGLILAP
jgi:phosphoribosyl 1,2-cyclic phosphodiesterase